MPQPGAPCGVIDTLDFPLYPPDARPSAYGGRDFGVFRPSYNGHHTGEDWWVPGRRASLGKPVYSIGHGTVTYAAPRGWGADQGVVIVRHVLPDGSTFLSMYGHLDPPSVILSVGDCVARGDQVGQIGDPRSPPHLHFEIRTHLPTSPGPGYWSVDPTLAGWKPPSQTIWNYRIAQSPGVQWTRPFIARDTRGLGMLDRDTFAAVEDNQLVGINVLDGSLRWRQPISVNLIDAAVDVDRSTIYTAYLFGQIEAFRIPEPGDGQGSTISDASLEPLWTIKIDTVGFATLMPLPDGGVAVSTRRKLFGVSAAGELLWERDVVAQVFDWALAEDLLIVSVLGRDGFLWTVDESGPTEWPTQISGRPVVVGDEVLLYDEDSIYRLVPETLATELLYVLPHGSLWLSDMVALPDGGVLLAHTDRFDRRLIALDADGRLRWERSFADVTKGQQGLLVLDDRAYLVSQDGTGSYNEVSLFAIDLSSTELTRIFTAGSRNPMPEDTWALAIGNDHILINVGGGNMAALDIQAALEGISQAAQPP